MRDEAKHPWIKGGLVLPKRVQGRVFDEAGVKGLDALPGEGLAVEWADHLPVPVDPLA